MHIFKYFESVNRHDYVSHRVSWDWGELKIHFGTLCSLLFGWADWCGFLTASWEMGLYC